MKLEFQEYRARKIVNVYRHVDGAWFWNKYSANPYIGCRSGCEFCYLRGGHYLGRRDPATFDTLIQVKINAIELLEKELSCLIPDVIACGDWQQPAEDHYSLSRKMLQVVHNAGFPLFIIERSPLLVRDLDLLTEIKQRAGVIVAFSISNLDDNLKRIFEPHSPGIKSRLQAMATLAQAGISVGTALMPIMPMLGDDEKHLEEMIIATKEHGGSFVVGGGLSMEGHQAERSLNLAAQLDPGLEKRWRQFYNWSSQSKFSQAPRVYKAKIGTRIRELCAKHNLQDRIPRLIIPGLLAINKRIAEQLYLRTYDLELEQAADYRIWAYRKAAWTVDELKENIAEIYYDRGVAALRELPGIGKSLVGEIIKCIQE